MDPLSDVLRVAHFDQRRVSARGCLSHRGE